MVKYYDIIKNRMFTNLNPCLCWQGLVIHIKMPKLDRGDKVGSKKEKRAKKKSTL